MLAQDFSEGDRVAFVGTDVPATVIAVRKDRIDVCRDDGIHETVYDAPGLWPRTGSLYRLPHM